MARHFIMVFRRKDTLNTMLALRRLGWTYQSLALVFSVDHSSIYNACKIRGIPVPKEPISLSVPSLLSHFIEAPKPAPKVKLYHDYLEEARRRRFPKLYKEQLTV